MMKNVYTMLLAGTALALATDAQAQRSSKSGHNATAFETIRPISSQNALRGGGGPPNDECDGAVNQDLAIGGTVTFTGDNTDATDSSGPDSLGIAQTWETFTISECANITIDYCGTAGPFGNAFLAVFTGCPFDGFFSAASFDQTTCPDGNVSLFYTELPAGQYYYAVMRDPDNSAVGPYTINVSATACEPPPPAPANDECEAAIPLTPGTSCVGTPFTTNGATQTLDPIECADFTSANAFDVFFSFTATAETMTIGVIGFNEADAMVELFEGACGSLTSLACADATFPQTIEVDGEVTTEELVQTGLTIGTTYTVRVYDWGHNSPEHNFEICVVEGEGSGIGMEENTVAEFVLFPNPGTGVFNLQYTGQSGLANIEVMDVTGRIVYNEQARVNNGTILDLDLTGMSTGSYNVRLTVGGVRTEQRLMVK
jgi:Secretion system C-terminal sorting domain